jgi:hypothetical protein
MPDETLDQFVERSKREIDAFATLYRTQMEVDPENWPSEMAPVDWNDQITSYLNIDAH